MTITQRPILLAVFALGVGAVIAQLVLMRELLAAFAGNELVLGIVLGNWLLLTGLGTSLGRFSGRLRQPLRWLAFCALAVAVLPATQVAAVRLLRDVVFTRGAVVGVLETVLASAAVLAPFCVVSGFMLVLGSHLLAAERDGIGKVYVADSLGSIAGGALFSFAIVFYFDHIGAVLLPAIWNLAVAFGLAAIARARSLQIAAALLLVGVGVAENFDLDARTTAWQYRGQQVVFHGNSPYGRLVVTESAGQRNFIQNGVPLFSTDNTEQIEETVHFAMAQRPDARRVLLLGGGVTGTARELLKYLGVAVTYIELDPLILQVAGNAAADPRVHTVAGDPRRFVQRTSERFEVIILDVPAPSTLQLNRYFTREFLAEAKCALAPGGVIAFALGSYANYISPELGRLLAAADATAREVFAHTRLIPGNRVFFLASDGELTTGIRARLPAGLKWLTPAHLDALLAPDRLADLQRTTTLPATVNRDFQPSLYLAHLRHWLAMFPVRYGLFIAALGLAGLLYVARLRGGARIVFAGGFAATALEIVLLLGFQILYGSTYRQLGVLVTLFMAGLAAGAWWANRRNVALGWLAVGLGAFAALLPVGVRVGWLIGPLTFALAGLVGMEFAVASRAGKDGAAMTASRLYTADFVGACLGALVASTLLIPLAGVAATCWITAGLNVAAGWWWWRQ